VDVEDWYQATVDFDAPITSRVVANTERLLEFLEACGVKGTFFVQGLVAVAFPALVRRIAQAGHEIQSHGHTHRPLFAMDRAALRHELDAARASVEDACGERVTAFRAPDFSILAGNLWALETLAEAGFRVDSSVFPIAMRRYGVAGFQCAPQKIAFPSGREILEVPVATWGSGRVRVPVGGGGYARLLPRVLLERGLRACVDEGRPPIVYCHPYEFNASELDGYRGRVPLSLRLHQGLGRRALVKRLRGLFAAMPFGRLDDVLAARGLA
jgi:polysaccharide deacetylase family protein (PEP-CTERM system associated)